jgi:hypothetical protein
MPLDAISTLLKENLLTTREELKKRFTFEWLAGKIIERQQYFKDTIIIIIGDRGAGKSNWGLKLIRAYIKLRRVGDPKFKWSWKNNFPLTRTQARKMGSILVKSFVCHDEGGDQFYTQEGIKRAQRDLVKFMNKDRSKLNLKIIIWPDPYTLDPKVINMAHLLVMVPYRYRNVCSFAFIYGRNPNPLTYDKFGIMKIRKRLDSPTKTSVYMQQPTMDATVKIRHNNRDMEIPYPKQLFKFLRTVPTFMKSHRYGPVDKRFEQAYINNVKDKVFDNEDEDRYVPIMTYNKLREQYEILLYNLYVRNDMSYAQLERLHISPLDGQHVRSIPGIKRSINSVKARK